MRAMKYGLIAAAFALVSTPAIGQDRLVGQTVRGTQRTCIYEGPKKGIVPTDTRFVTIVGRGEPCPANYPKPDSKSSSISPMATLKSQRVGPGVRECIYGYLGRSYSKVIEVSRSCPLTPHFSY